MEKLLKLAAICLLSCLFVNCSKSTTNKSLSIPYPPNPGQLTTISQLDLTTQIRLNLGYTFGLYVDSAEYGLPDDSINYVDSYSSFYWNSFQNLHLIYQVNSTSCIDFAGLYSVFSSVEASNNRGENLRLAIGMMVVQQKNSALGVNGDNSGKLYHAVNIFLTKNLKTGEAIIYVVEPQTEIKCRLSDYSNRNEIQRIEFF